MAQEPVINVEDLTFSYDGFPVLEDVNVAIHERDFACILGPNGGGKTTLLKLILGLLRPTKGRVQVFGAPPERARTRVGYVPQSYEYDPQFPVRVIDVVLMGRLDKTGRPGPYRRSDREAALAALREVEILELRHRPLAVVQIAQFHGGSKVSRVLRQYLVVHLSDFFFFLTCLVNLNQFKASLL